MSNETEFVSGLIAKAPNDNAPDYIKARLSIKREDLIAWLQTKSDEWINADVKVSQGGKWYAAVDTWKPTAKAERSDFRPEPLERLEYFAAEGHVVTDAEILAAMADQMAQRIDAARDEEDGHDPG